MKELQFDYPGRFPSCLAATVDGKGDFWTRYPGDQKERYGDPQ